jgi:hypothetical protein
MYTVDTNTGKEQPMTIALIRSYTDKPWRSPETFDLIEAALAERWRVVSVRAEDRRRSPAS